MALTEQVTLDGETDFNNLAKFLSGQEIDFILRDGTPTSSILKLINGALGSGYVRSDDDGEIDGTLTTRGISIYDPDGVENRRHMIIKRYGSGVAFVCLNDDGTEYSSPAFINRDGFTAFVGKDKILNSKTVKHAGGLVNCGATPSIIGGYGIGSATRISEGFYQLKLTRPLSDREKAGVTLSAQMSIYGLQLSCAWYIPDNETIQWNVRRAWGEASDYLDGGIVDITINDYS